MVMLRGGTGGIKLDREPPYFVYGKDPAHPTLFAGWIADTQFRNVKWYFLFSLTVKAPFLRICRCFAIDDKEA